LTTSVRISTLSSEPSSESESESIVIGSALVAAAFFALGAALADAAFRFGMVG